MITSLSKRLAVAAVLLSSLSFCLADDYTKTFGDNTTAVYDISGTYDVNLNFPTTGGNTLSFTATFPVVQNYVSGALSGSDPTCMISFGNDTVSTSCKVSGKIYGGNGATHASITLTYKGKNQYFSTVKRSCSVTLKYDLSVTSSGLSGKLTSATWSISGLGSGKLTQQAVSDWLPENATYFDNTWTVSLTYTAIKKIVGQGQININRGYDLSSNSDNNPQLQMGSAKVTGTVAKDGSYETIKVACPKPYSGNSFQMVLNPAEGSNPAPVRLSGKLLGQHVVINN